MENGKNRVDLKLTPDHKMAAKCFSELHKDCKFINGLYLIELFRKEIYYNKPSYVGA
jgi:hypothetical protein